MEKEEKCTCGCDENCECGCMDGKECTCHECECGDDCCCEVEPLEEKLVLVGKTGDSQTKEAIEFLNKKKVDYTFLDLEKESLFNLEDIEIPSLLLVQTIVSGIAPGIDNIKNSLK